MDDSLTTALAVAATLVCVAFAMCTWERWLRSRKDHERSWTIALVLSAAAAAALAWGAALGWSTGTFRLFYACGAVANVPFLALGQVQLMRSDAAARPRNRGPGRVASAVHLSAAFGLGVLAVAPAKAIDAQDGLPKGSDVFGALPRVLAAVGSAGGAVIVLGGALWGTGRLLRVRSTRRAPGVRQRAAGSALIAVGTLILGASGGLNSVLGAMRAFSVTLVAGMVVLFAGFLLASTAQTATSTSTSTSQPPTQAIPPAPATAVPPTSTHPTPPDSESGGVASSAGQLPAHELASQPARQR